MATKTEKGKATDSPRTDFSVTEAADSLGTLLNRVAFGGEEITIHRGKNKTPVAKLVPLGIAS